MTVGTTLNNVGVMSAKGSGVIAACRAIMPAGVDSSGRALISAAVDAKAASVSDTDRVIGVSTPDRDNADGDTVQYYSQIGSRLLGTAGAAIAADKDLMVTTDGKLIEATFTAGQTTQLVGRSCEAAAADLDLFSFIFFPQLVSVGTSADDLVVGDDLTVGDDATITGDLVAGTITTAGDVSAAGGFRHVPGVFRRDNVAATLTDSQLALAVHGASLNGYVATRAGSITGLSIHSTVAAAGGAGDKLVATVFKNGVAIAAAKVELDADTSEVADAATFAKDTHTFAAEDVLDIRITTPGTWSAVTADIAVFLEVED